MIEIDVQEEPLIEIDIEDHTESQVAGTTDYEELINKPAIEGNEIWKHTKLEDIGIKEITNEQIKALFN